MFDENLKIKHSLINRWRAGGTETLVKVMASGVVPRREYAIGYCTEIKFLAGRTPLDIERAVGLRDNTKLAAGAKVYAVSPLPRPVDFDFAGYSNTPEGISTAVKPAHPDYPPGLGVPQWNVLGLTQEKLVMIAEIVPGQSFRFDARTLGPW